MMKLRGSDFPKVTLQVTGKAERRDPWVSRLFSMWGLQTGLAFPGRIPCESVSPPFLLYESFIFSGLHFQASLRGQVIKANPINLSDSKGGSHLTGSPLHPRFLNSHKHLMEHNNFHPDWLFQGHWQGERVFLLASCVPLKIPWHRNPALRTKDWPSPGLLLICCFCEKPKRALNWQCGLATRKQAVGFQPSLFPLRWVFLAGLQS